MKRVALAVFLASLLAPAAVWAAKPGSSPVSFKLVRADARVTLRFYQQSADGTSINHGRVVTHVKGKPPGHGRLAAGRGKMTFPVSGKVLEHVRLVRAQLNQETTCEQTRKIAAKGGVKFRPVGSKVKVRWKFPQSRVSFCPGPPTDSTLTAGMTKTYPAGKFKHSVVTIKLAGDSSEQDGSLLQATYKWRATLTLERVS
jgi:hypothetical protein